MESNRIKFLFVEDDKIDQMMFQRFIEKEKLPYDYVVENSVSGAKLALEKGDFHIILSDYHLGDGTVFDLFGCFSEDIPVVVITGGGSEEIAVKAMKMGATDYLIKDPDGYYLKTLSITVDKALKAKTSERVLREYREHLEEMVQKRTEQLSNTVKHLENEIKERKRVEKSLKKSEEFFEKTFNDMVTMVAVMNPDGKIIFVNNTFLATSGLSRGEILGSKIYNSTLWDYSDDVRLTTYYDVKECSLGKTFTREIQAATGDGKLIWVDYSMHPVYSEDNKIIFMVGESRDITEKKIIQEQLRQSQKMEAVGTLAGGIAHDFNNILTAINGYSELALLSVQKSDPVYDRLVNIRNMGDRAAMLTRQILAFSRKQDYEPENVAINFLLEGMSKMLKRMIPEDIDIEFRLEKNLPSIKADPAQLEQVVMNLVVNARDALDGKEEKTGDEKIIIETTPALDGDDPFFTILPDLSPGEYIVLTVRDTGIGMDDAVKERIFEPFFTTKEKGKGTGLGLSTVFGIIKQNNAHITVSSAPGSGAQFRILWPAVKENGVTLTGKKKEEVTPLGTETILLVEDDQMVRDLTAELLKGLNYKVYAATNGVDALEQVQRKKIKFDLLITDVRMPKMSGDKLAAHLEKIAPDAKVLFISGYINKRVSISEELDSNLNFLKKPFTRHELGCKVRFLLDGYAGSLSQDLQFVL